MSEILMQNSAAEERKSCDTHQKGVDSQQNNTDLSQENSSRSRTCCSDANQPFPALRADISDANSLDRGDQRRIVMRIRPEEPRELEAGFRSGSRNDRYLVPAPPSSRRPVFFLFRPLRAGLSPPTIAQWIPRRSRPGNGPSPRPGIHSRARRGTRPRSARRALGLFSSCSVRPTA